MIERLKLGNQHWLAMDEYVRRCWPEEACGLLAGSGEIVERVYRIENIRHSPVDYYMDPTQQVTAMLEIESAGWEILSIFHSHPAGPSYPSATDVDRAYYPDAVYVILAPSDGQTWKMRGFQIEAGLAREVPIERLA